MIRKSKKINLFVKIYENFKNCLEVNGIQSIKTKEDLIIKIKQDVKKIYEYHNLKNINTEKLCNINNLPYN